MPRTEIWRRRAPEIYLLLSRTEEWPAFDWENLARLFRVSRRTASRIIASLQPRTSKGKKNVSRTQLLKWLGPIRLEVEQQRTRAATLIQHLRAAELEDQARRDAFRAKFGAQPPSWTPPDSATISTLPTGVSLGPGKIEINFPDGDPIAACNLLHALSLSITHDWPRFCARVAPSALAAAGDPIESFLQELERQKNEGHSF
jgi:hypothetical protein